MSKSNKGLSRFVVYQPDSKVFHVCLEVGNVYYCWWSNYPPAQDNRFARKVTRLKAIMPKVIPAKQVYDKGTYTVNKGDDKATTEKKVKEGVKQRSFSFILNGEVLNGRFIIKQTSVGTMLQKFKDKFVVTEDILGGDLSRTISLMVPDYDPDSVKLPYSQKRRISIKPPKAEPLDEVEDEPAGEIAADKKLGNTWYHFDLYHSDTGPELCIVYDSKNGVLVLKKNRHGWELLKAAKKVVPEKEKELAEHAEALYKLQY
ncbi:hypothetical protein [Niabella aquatica]